MRLVSQVSPNCGPRRLGAKPDLIVLHYTAMADCQAALDWLCNPVSEVSAHYLISEAGDVIQMVQEADRAWHAGAGAWGGCTDVNSRSIGVELSNCGFSPFAEAQMGALETLLPRIMEHWSIPPERVIGHSDMAPVRKVDPGVRFDWRRLAQGGLSVWPQGLSGGNIPPDPDGFCQMAGRFGYPVSTGFGAILSAFRLRFRPRETGPLDGVDMALIKDLSHRFPVDRPGNQP